MVSTQELSDVSDEDSSIESVSEDEGAPSSPPPGKDKPSSPSRPSLFRFVESEEEEDPTPDMVVSQDLTLGQRTPARHPTPLEPRVVIQEQPPQRTPERPKTPAAKRKQKKPAATPNKAPSGKGESQKKGNTSAATSHSTGSDQSHPQGKQAPEDPPAYIKDIFAQLLEIQNRMTAYETNQFRGFSPRRESRGQQTTSPPPSTSENFNPPPSTSSSQNRSVPAVSIADPPVVPSSLHLIPEGWKVLHDGMALGREPGSIVFPDGSLYTSQTIDIDVDAFERPIWRFKRRHGTSRAPKGKVPVRVAYESFYDLFQADPVGAREWLSSSFKPPGSSSDRALTLNLEDEAMVSEFFAKAKEWFMKMAKDEKVTWEEASSPANVVPESISSISAQNFVKTFGHKPFNPADPGRIFNTDRIPNLPKSDR